MLSVDEAVRDVETTLKEKARGRIFSPDLLTPSALAQWVVTGEADFRTGMRKAQFTGGPVPRLNDDLFAELVDLEGTSDLIVFLGEYVRAFLPARALTESDYWVCSCLTADHQLARISAGPVQVLSASHTTTGSIAVRFWMARTPIHEAYDQLSETVRALGGREMTGAGATQRAGGTDQISFDFSRLDSAREFAANEQVATSIRLYNALQFADSRTRWHTVHTPAAVDSAFDQAG